LNDTRITKAGYDRLKQAFPNSRIDWAPLSNESTSSGASTASKSTAADRDRQAAEQSPSTPVAANVTTEQNQQASADSALKLKLRTASA
jgi:hypothetical protein